MTNDLRMDTAFRKYAELELRRHRLLSGDKDESSEMDEAESQMDELWPMLDDVQQRSLRGMASDLNWLRRNGEPPPKGRKTPAEVPDAEVQALAHAVSAKDWHRVLHYLRLCAPTFEIESLAHELATAYGGLGLSGYAKEFEMKALGFPVARIVR